MTTTTTANIAHLVLLALVTIHLPLSVVSMDTENGYLCNLCHSLQNELPYPPPDAEPKVVRFTQLQDEQFGLPWDRGITCLEVWNIVLDFANPNVHDETSCRSMAAAYAPQCCHHITNDDPESHRLEQQQQESNSEEGAIEGAAASTEELPLTLPAQQYEATYNASGENTKKTRPTTGRLSTPSMGIASRETNVDSKTSVETETLALTLTEEQSFRERESHSSMGTGRNDGNDGDNDNNIRRTTASTSYLRGKPEAAP